MFHGFEGLAWRGNIYRALVLRLLLAMFLFTLCRAGFYIYNYSYFPDISADRLVRIFLGGLKFDLTAVLYLNLLFILLHAIPFNFRFHATYQAILKYLFFLANGVGLAANVADFIYYKFTLRRTTADIFDEFSEGPGAGNLFFRFIVDYWYASLFLVVLLWLMGYLYRKIHVRGPMMTHRLAYYLGGTLAIPLIAYLFVGGVRGGFRHSTRPITLSNAGEFVENPNETSIVLNTPFSIMRTVGKNKVKKANYFADEASLASVYSPIHIPTDTIPFQKQNVVIIMLESFSKEFFGIFNQDKPGYGGYTPFLDSLVLHSKAFRYSFANGRKSIDAPPSALASLPTFTVPFVLTPFANDDFNSVASLLEDEGYHSSFFIGHPNGAMGYSSFTKLAGFQHYYGMDEYGNDDDFDGIWGIWDHKFFRFFADKVSEFPEPFVTVLFSVSSHHPFIVPDSFAGVFKGGEQPILKCVQYTDYSLRELFKRISKEAWYPNTLFVFTADHCSSDIIFEESRTTRGLFSVPIFFFKPDNSLTAMEPDIIQQADIMPSVLGYLHYQKPYLAFGRDVFREKTIPKAFNYRDAYNLYMGDYLLNFDGDETTGLYHFKSDTLLANNLVLQQHEVADEMANTMKAVIQQYNNRLLDNKLRVPH